MWKTYNVELQYVTPCLGGIPYSAEVTEAWLKARLKGISTEELAKLTGEYQKDMTPEEIKKALEEQKLSVWCGFTGLPYTADKPHLVERHIKGMLKDAYWAVKKGGLAGTLKIETSAYKMMVNRTVFADPKIYFYKNGKPADKPDRFLETFVHTPMANGLKKSDLIEDARLKFTLKTFGASIPPETLVQLFKYGEEGGISAQRSFGFGKYKLLKFDEVDGKAGRKRK